MGSCDPTRPKSDSRRQEWNLGVGSMQAKVSPSILSGLSTRSFSLLGHALARADMQRSMRESKAHLLELSSAISWSFDWFTPNWAFIWCWDWQVQEPKCCHQDCAQRGHPWGDDQEGGEVLERGVHAVKGAAQESRQGLILQTQSIISASRRWPRGICIKKYFHLFYSLSGPA